ncbi:MAG: hypothetical protein ABIV50_11945 [Opitutus sp.]
MKFLCRALCVLFIATCAVRAQDESPLGDFAPLDDDLVLYIPKFAVKLGFRGISGVKTSFGGNGSLLSSSILEGATGPANRLYHDGYVVADSRTLINPSGNPDPITPDGRTNEWAFKNDSQTIDAQGNPTGLVAMHTYAALTNETTFAPKDPPSGFGVELSLDRDLGSVFGTRMKWGIVGGMSINQISTASTGSLSAMVTTTTDLYSLGGQAAPIAPFAGPSFAGSIDTTPLLGSDVLSRTVTTSLMTGAIGTSSKLRGAYMSFRLGASLFVPISARFSAMVSGGAVLVYAGTAYQVTQTFKPDTGDTIAEFISDTDSTILAGYYADASLQFAINDTAGLYLGAVYQSSGDFDQDAVSADGTSKYTTRIDLSSLQGIRAGVSFKF